MITILYNLISDVSRLPKAAINMSIYNGKLKIDCQTFDFVF
jgi:hypothetical protein